MWIWSDHSKIVPQTVKYSWDSVYFLEEATYEESTWHGAGPQHVEEEEEE